MKLIFLLQLALPLLFIAWIALAPQKSTFGFFCQIVGVATALFALTLTGLWLFPPWWTPYAFMGLFMVAGLMGLRKRFPFATWRPKGRVALASTALFIALGGWGTYQSVNALTGRMPQTGVMVDLTFPLNAGTYLVVNGGSNIVVNPHLITLNARMARFRAYRGQSYGVDIVKINDWGFRAKGLQPRELSAYEIYGVPVYAPCSGVVVAAIDGLPDMPVPQMDREHMAGNHILVRCNAAEVLLGHFKPGSLKVSEGDMVAVGQAVGAVGNSGNTGEPHLHIHAQQHGTTSEPHSGNPLPMRFDSLYLIRNERVVVP